MNLFKSKNSKYILAVVLLATAFFWVGINRVPVPTVDGVIRANQARTVVNTGVWYPFFNDGEIFTDHPPLYIWLLSLSFKVFGVQDISYNIVERFFAFFAVIATYLLAAECGLGAATALVSAVILCLTRDFVLSSVRGYVEPMLLTFTCLSLACALATIRKKDLRYGFLTGILVFFIAFTKGPPVFWPFLFIAVLFFFNRPLFKKREIAFEKYTTNTGIEKTKMFFSYLGGVLFCSLIFFAWMKHGHFEPYFKQYWFKQVVASAVEGRNGAQRLEPFYFANILATYYWPWLPIAIYAAYLFAKNYFVLRANSTRAAFSFYGFLLFIFAFGFIGGFSMVKWKFWYYIAPAYPPLAVMIAIFLMEFTGGIFGFLKKEKIPKFISKYSVVWIILTVVFPIPLHLERAPEVYAFKKAALESEAESPVWFIHSPTVDHNIIGSSGQWAFKRMVVKVSDEEEKTWATKLKSPSLIFTWKNHWEFCNSKKAPAYMQEWCLRSKLLASHKDSVLVEYR